MKQLQDRNGWIDLSEEPIEASFRMKTPIILLTVLYLVSFLAGYVSVHYQLIFALELRDMTAQTVLRDPLLMTVLGALRAGDLTQAILVTLIVNLIIGAFISTTLPGVVPIIGILLILHTTVYRGGILGIVYYGVLASSVSQMLVGLGTLILELGGYVFSGAAGINIGLALIFPKRYSVESRWTAFLEAWKDALRIYTVVLTLLVLGSVWEMTGLLLLIR